MRAIPATALLATFAVGLSATPSEATTYPDLVGVYTFTPDYRRCPSPLCGGWWIRAVNHTQTTCFDGTVAAACYVADIDWAAMGWSPAEVSRYQTAVGNGKIGLFGRQDAGAYPGFPGLAVFTPRKALIEFMP